MILQVRSYVAEPMLQRLDRETPRVRTGSARPGPTATPGGSTTATSLPTVSATSTRDWVL